jgi:cell division protein ZapA
MPELEITIAGRNFQVACQPGEEHFLRSAAMMLDSEAQPLISQLGRLSEARVLLMAGLMLADKTASVEDENRQLKARLADIEQRPAPEPELRQVAVMPASVIDSLAEVAARVEALADRLEDQ